jgi:hypothetical protein
MRRREQLHGRHAATPCFREVAFGNPRTSARERPMSVSAFEGWSLGSALPFTTDGRLNLTTLRH